MFFFRLWTSLLVLPFLAGCAGSPYYLHLSDVHLDATGQSKDTGPGLWEAARSRIKSLVDSGDAPAFVLFTGDLAVHYACKTPDCKPTTEQSKARRTDMRTVLSDLDAIVDGTAIPLFFVPGNNDSLTGDYYSFATKEGRTPFSLVPDAEFPALNSSPDCDAGPPCVVSQPNPRLGYYSARPIKRLRVIVLNSVPFGQRYGSADGVERDKAIDEQLAWLGEQMMDLGPSERTLIAMHIPPGVNAWAVAHGRSDPDFWKTPVPASAEDWQNRFLEVIGPYRDALVGVAFGHSHLDEIRRFHDRSGAPLALGISAPGITPVHGNNPGFKTVSLDPRSLDISRFETHFVELDQPSGFEHWQTYTSDGIYGCPESAKGSPLFICLTRSPYQDVRALATAMHPYLAVRRPPPAFDPAPGVEVRFR